MTAPGSVWHYRGATYHLRGDCVRGATQHPVSRLLDGTLDHHRADHQERWRVCRHCDDTLPDLIAELAATSTSAPRNTVLRTWPHNPELDRTRGVLEHRGRDADRVAALAARLGWDARTDTEPNDTVGTDAPDTERDEQRRVVAAGPLPAEIRKLLGSVCQPYVPDDLAGAADTARFAAAARLVTDMCDTVVRATTTSADLADLDRHWTLAWRLTPTPAPR